MTGSKSPGKAQLGADGIRQAALLEDHGITGAKVGGTMAVGIARSSN